MLVFILVIFHFVTIKKFVGIKARVMYQMPSTAICWSTYEFFKYLLGTKTEIRIVPAPGTVLAEEKEMKMEAQPEVHVEKYNLKSRELPAMSGAGLYGSISFNTMHKADYRQKDSVLDIAHT